MRLLVAVVGVCLLVAAAPRPAAACSKRHQPLFELATLARDVAVVKVTAAPGHGRAGAVSMRVTRALKGRRATLTAHETNTSCATGFRRGKTALVFLDARRWPVGSFEGYIEKPSPAVIIAMTTWLAATTPRARAEVLVGAIAGNDRTLRADAAQHLLDEPELLAALTPDALAVLVAAVSANVDKTATTTILTVLLRVHGDAWKQLVASAPTTAPTTAPPDRAVAALLAHDLEAITDPAVLADRIDAGKGDYDPARIAATDRCERVRGVRLSHFSSYASGRSDHGWKQLAEACRTGTPLAY